MKIRKTEPSVGILGKIVNLFSNSTKDTYSCDYMNNKISEVVKNGLNSSGEYTKFSDGTIHCYGTSSVITFTGAGVKDASVDLTPFNLKSNKNVQLTLMVNYSDYGNGKFQVHLKSSDINKITFSVRNEYTSNINFYVSWFVIGKWE